MPLPTETNGGLVLAEAKDQAYFLALFDRIFPSDYLEPLKSPGPGYEIFEALAAVGARLSLAIARLKVGNFISSADGGQYAQANVLFLRPAFTAGAVTIKAGTLVTTSVGDRTFALLSDVLFGATDLGPLPGTVQAISLGYEYNVRGQRVAASGLVLPGEIDTISKLIEDPSFGDPTITISQVDDATGGQAAMLDQLGIDRGMGRVEFETDASYRPRIASIPDTVSPGAVRRAVNAILQPLGLSFQFIEIWDLAYQTCFDAPSAVIPGSTFDPNLFCYDDPRAATPFRNRYLDEVEARGTFIVVVPATLSSAGVRALWDMLQEIKAAGVVAGLEREGN